MQALCIYLYFGSVLSAWLLIYAVGGTPKAMTPLLTALWPVAWPIMLVEAIRRFSSLQAPQSLPLITHDTTTPHHPTAGAGAAVDCPDLA